MKIPTSRRDSAINGAIFGALVAGAVGVLGGLIRFPGPGGFGAAVGGCLDGVIFGAIFGTILGAIGTFWWMSEEAPPNSPDPNEQKETTGQ